MMMAIADALESECIDRVIPELDEFNRPIPDGATAPKPCSSASSTSSTPKAAPSAWS
jgi:hypothetical protein